MKMPKNKKYSEEQKRKRVYLWPEVEDNCFWHATHEGFTFIPRTMPIILKIIDDLTKNKPASTTYLALWAHSSEAMYVNAVSESENLACFSGFSGQRAVSTWRERIRSLAKLGFILIKKGPMRPMDHIAILNPHYVIRRLKEEKQTGLTDKAFSLLMERADKIKAKDEVSPLPGYFTSSTFDEERRKPEISKEDEQGGHQS